MEIVDNGPEPNVFDLETATEENTNYRTTAWTGKYLQVTLMSIPVGESIGWEVHPETDQFLRLEEGELHAKIGPSEDDLEVDEVIAADWAAFVPAGKWHNFVNESDAPAKLYSIYAPAEHEPGTRHETKADADNDPNETDAV